jgi:hypothetical protein
MLLRTYTALLAFGACLSNALPQSTISNIESATHTEDGLTKRAR